MKTVLLSIFIFFISWSELPGQTYPQLPHQNNIQTVQADAASFRDLSDTLNNNIENEATIAVSEDNQAVLSYKDDKGNGNLYISILNENKWTAPEKLNKISYNKNKCIQ